MTDSRTTSSRRPEVASVASSLPDAIEQAEVAAFASSLHPGLEGSRALRVFDNAGIERRHLACPLEWYRQRRPPGERFRLAAELAAHYATAAAKGALQAAAVDADQVDTAVFVSTTVLQAPNLEVALADSLGLRPDVRRVPLFGLASLGGAAGLGLAADLVRGGDSIVLVVASEMNSLTFVPDDDSMETVVTMALFSDGAAAALVRGTDQRDANVRDGLEVVGRHSTLVPDSLDMMGFDATDEGLRWRLAPDVPDVALTWTRRSVEDAVASAGWSLADIDHALVHPGGSRVLDAVEQSLGWPPERLHWSRETMRDHGNVSSATVLLVLERFLAVGPPPGRALLTAMGPGFGFEHVLLQTAAS